MNFEVKIFTENGTLVAHTYVSGEDKDTLIESLREEVQSASDRESNWLDGVFEEDEDADEDDEA